MANTYDIGDQVQISNIFSNASGPLDPTTVSLAIKAPDGTVTTYTYAAAEITKDSTGVYHKDISITAAGTYRYRWTSTGTGQGSEEGWFQVRSRQV